MNAEVTVDDASISPFSAVTLRNLKVRTTGDQPLISAAEVRLRYSDGYSRRNIPWKKSRSPT
jgi:hypothetical protein